MNILEKYQQVMPYLIVENASDFISFMQKVFDVKETYNQMRDGNKIMHAEIMIGRSTIMFADATYKFKLQNAGLFM